MDITQDFFEKIILLVFTAVITGFGVPYVLKRIEERKLHEQKKYEAGLARQAEIIKAQSQLLDDLSGILWKWRYLAKKVVYYAGENNQDRFDIARQSYDEKVWDLLNDLRVEISKARRLVSENAYKALRAAYEYITSDVDIQITTLARKENLDAETVKESEKLSLRFTSEVSQKIDDLIDDLASEIGLKVKT